MEEELPLAEKGIDRMIKECDLELDFRPNGSPPPKNSMSKYYSKSTSELFDSIHAIPHFKTKANHIFALALSGEKRNNFILYWLEYFNSKLRPVTKYDNFNLHSSGMDDSSPASMLNSMNISYLASVDNLLEKLAWIEVRGTPGLALIRLDMTIDLYFFHGRRRPPCHQHSAICDTSI